MIGLPALRSLLSEQTPELTSDTEAREVNLPGSLAALVDEIETGEHGLVLCMGKGGVGKTTIAAAIAVELAHRGHPVHLTTTDPAAHLEETLHGTVAGLRVSRIDPEEATREYRDRVMATKGKNLDEAGRRNLSEDLLSPCTEEVAVFQQFSKAVHESRHEFVVVDTAPTGHTLLLLDAAGSYHREVVRQMGDAMPYTTPLCGFRTPARPRSCSSLLPSRPRSQKHRSFSRTSYARESTLGRGSSTTRSSLRTRSHPSSRSAPTTKPTNSLSSNP